MKASKKSNFVKTYLVTGAAGFIGSAVARALQTSGHQVVTVDNLSTGRIENLPEGIHFIRGNCHDPEIIDLLAAFSFEAIFHIAGQSSGEISFEDPLYDLHSNTQSTLLLLDMAKRMGCTKFIYASTMSIYGDVENIPVSESAMPNPKSFYGVGKLASENYLKIYNREFQISTASLRLFNVYGPGQNLSNMKQGMVSIFLAQAQKYKHIVVKGSRDRYRDFIYIDDVVEAFLRTEKVLKDDKSYLFNVCCGIKTTVGNLVDCIITQFSTEVSCEYKNSTVGDQFGIYGSPDRMNSILGNWEKVRLTDGVRAHFASLTR